MKYLRLVLFFVASALLAQQSDRTILATYKAQYDSPQARLIMRAEIEKAGGKIVSEIPSIKATQIQVNDPKNLYKLRDTLVKSGKYVSVEIEGNSRPDQTNDPDLKLQWHLTKMNVPSAWKISQGGSVKVAVLDSGIDRNHPDLRGRSNAGWSFTANSMIFSDNYGHGTKTAGTIIQIANNAVAGSGVTWYTTVTPYQITTPTGYASYGIQAAAIIRAVDEKHRIISISYSGTSYSTTLCNAVKYAWDRNVLVFASTGNNGAALKTYPAGCPFAVAVGSTNSSDERSWFSNYGDYVTLVAPGESILTTTVGGGYAYASGTSFATPIAAGVAALVLSTNVSMTNQQLLNKLKESVVDLGAPGWDPMYGAGRLDALKAVK